MIAHAGPTRNVLATLPAHNDLHPPSLRISLKTLAAVFAPDPGPDPDLPSIFKLLLLPEATAAVRP